MQKGDRRYLVLKTIRVVPEHPPIHKWLTANDSFSVHMGLAEGFDTSDDAALEMEKHIPTIRQGFEALAVVCMEWTAVEDPFNRQVHQFLEKYAVPDDSIEAFLTGQTQLQTNFERLMEEERENQENIAY